VREERKKGRDLGGGQSRRTSERKSSHGEKKKGKKRLRFSALPVSVTVTEEGKNARIKEGKRKGEGARRGSSPSFNSLQYWREKKKRGNERVLREIDTREREKKKRRRRTYIDFSFIALARGKRGRRKMGDKGVFLSPVCNEVLGEGKKEKRGEGCHILLRLLFYLWSRKRKGEETRALTRGGEKKEKGEEGKRGDHDFISRKSSLLTTRLTKRETMEGRFRSNSGRRGKREKKRGERGGNQFNCDPANSRVLWLKEKEKGARELNADLSPTE